MALLTRPTYIDIVYKLLATDWAKNIPPILNEKVKDKQASQLPATWHAAESVHFNWIK